jgi:FemAB-related protein (PEP-CTERM system-associated)
MRSISAMPLEAGLAVGEVDASRMAAWDSWVREHEGAAIYHLAGWRELIEDVFGRDTHYLLAERGGRTTGVLPLVRLKSWVFGDFLTSLPYVTYGGVVAEDAESAARLLDAAARLGSELGVAHVELRHVHDCADLPKRTDKVSMHRRLTGDSDMLWKELGSKLRAQIKRPLKEGAGCEIGGVELVDEFYRVFSVKYRDLGVPVYPLAWFRGVLKRFAHAARVFVVRVDGCAVAASIVLGWRERLEVPWAASLRSADRYGVNMFLYWSMLKHAEEAGYRCFDFGRSTRDSGTFRFKKQWGAAPVQLYWHYWMRDGGEPPQLNAHNPKYQAAVAMWRRLPVWAANVLGPKLVKNLP